MNEKERLYHFTTFMDVVNITPKAVIVGLDEAGRGPLAGPVVAAACLLPCSLFQRKDGLWSPVKKSRRGSAIIGDSKMLSPEERETAFDWITRNCAWGIGSVEAEEIDNIGILSATERAMQQALTEIEKRCSPTYLLVDGRDRFWFNYPHSSVIDGDQKEPMIAAASIIAKVTRDRIMVEHDVRLPQYGFARHKGYGTPEHIEAIRTHGPSILHRHTFLTKLTSSSSQTTTKETHPQVGAVASEAVRV